MQPLAALTGIVLGSAVALLAGLLMTLVVFALLPEFRDRLEGEFAPLLVAVAWAALLAGISALAFLGQVKALSWRAWAQLGMWAGVLAIGWYYWP